MYPETVNTDTQTRRRRRKAPGCGVGILLTLVVLLIIVAASWFFALRPYLHNMAQSQLDRAMTSAVNQIPAQASQIPAGSTLQVKEDSITNLIVLNLAPADPVKNPAAHITTNNLRLQFQLYGYDCAVTAVPQVSQGHLVVNNVNVEGILGLIMSSDEMKSLLDKHLADAETRLQHHITAVQLQNHAMNLTLG